MTKIKSQCSLVRAAFLIVPMFAFFVSTTTRAGNIADGDYVMRLQAGTSGLSIGGTPADLTDNGVDAYSIFDSWAGGIGITVAGHTFFVSDFQIDTINNSVLGAVEQFTLNPTQMGGTINPTTGSMTFDPTGRLTSIGSPPTAANVPFNIDDTGSGNSAYTTFTTDTITCTDCPPRPGDPGTISGSVLTNITDIDGDLKDDYSVQLVSSGYLGSAFGAFVGAGYSELWDITIFSDTTGFVQGNPVLPTGSAPFTFSEIPSGLWTDPPATTGYMYSMTSGSLFTRILDFPTGFNSNFGVRVGAIDLGLFGPGEIVDFASLLGSGVPEFEIYDISPSVDSTDPQAFPLRLEFNTQTASFEMAATVPAPAAAWLFGSGLIGLLGLAKRKH